MLNVDFVEPLLQVQDFLRVQHDVRRLALEPARRLVDHDARIGNREPHVLGAGGQQQPRDLVPLLEQADFDALMKPWQAKVAEVEADKQRRQAAAKSASEKLQAQWSSSKRKLAEAKVAEGASVPFEQRVTVKRGEVVLLTVLPNDNHGADSTLVEWTIRETAGEQRSWSVADLVPDLISRLEGNDPAMRVHIIGVLARFNDPAVACALEQQFADSNKAVRKAALLAIENMPGGFGRYISGREITPEGKEGRWYDQEGFPVRRATCTPPRAWRLSEDRFGWRQNCRSTIDGVPVTANHLVEYDEKSTIREIEASVFPGGPTIVLRRVSP